MKGNPAPGANPEPMDSAAPTTSVALAGAVHGGGRGRSAARQDPAGAHRAVAQGRGRGGRDAHAGRGAAAGRDPLDGAGDGRGQRAQRQLGAADLAGARPSPHQVRSFKLSSDPNFATKVEDIVGLYVDPPAHAVVLSIDEKSQIQALDRTQPGLPMKPGRLGTMTHDSKRNGTTTLFASFNVLDGTVIGRCMQRHRHQEFIRFLNAVERAVPAGKVIHVILDNYAAHKHANVRRWLTRHPRWIFHFTRPHAPGSTPSRPCSPSSPNASSNAACSPPSSLCRKPSTTSSRPTTVTPSRSSGKPTPRPSSPPPKEGAKR
jgi:hypothetical protein